MQDLTIDDILAIFRRRRSVFLVTFALLSAATVLFTLSWSHYRATATIQIEQPYVSKSITAVGADAGSATGLADRRISQIEQNVTSVESLNAIITALNLYPGINKKMEANKLASIMRSKIKLDFISSDVANPAAAQKESVEQLSAIAFTLSFDYNDAKLSKKALDAIVARFIDEEATQRHDQAKETANFLDGEIKTLETSIRESELKIAEFRAKYGESGPSATMFNQQASMSNAMSLQNIEAQLSTSEATAASLRSQLATTSPYNLVTADGKQVRTGGSQLHALKSEYAALTTRYGPEHPDVLKVKAQLDALKNNGSASPISASRADADNPIYLQLSAQLASAEGQRRGLASQRAALIAQQSKYDAAIAKNPMIEQEMSKLTLDLDNAKERYHTLKDKKLAAEMQVKLESGKNRELLKILNPSNVPESTHPKRLLILLGGLFFALMSAIGAVLMLETISQSVRGANHLAAIVGVAPLVSVPPIAGRS
jgi:succinoglycan biosynthesis transport protein ExoP